MRTAVEAKMSTAAELCQNVQDLFGEAVSRALADIFSEMIPLPLGAAGDVEKRPEQFEDGFSALVGFVGDRRGLFGIHCNRELGQQCYQAMLGMDDDGTDEDIRDLVGEVANMLAGGVKAFLLDTGMSIEIAVPQVFSGGRYQVYLPAGGRWNGWVFQVNDAEILVELKLLD
ncbi:MAG: chemotaxis protein CheX [Deltaproteobacteria bacterium]|nr:MAG: chemotaxis protein CheX [Deltaproteobacteria bacterium]